MQPFRKFPSIQGLHNVLKLVNKYPEVLPSSSKITYRAKEKLHGTNAGIEITKNSITARKRNGYLIGDADNYGFREWMETDEVTEWLKKLQKLFFVGNPLALSFVIHGEWVGPGVQKKVALAEGDKKAFAVFSIEVKSTEGEDLDVMVIQPWQIHNMLVDYPDNVRVIEWMHSTGDSYDFHVDVFNTDHVTMFADKVTALVEDIENDSVFARFHYGIPNGTGEGVVMYPILPDTSVIPRKLFSDLAFKAKGQKHQVAKTDKKIVEINPEVLRSRNAFVEKFVTENRCQQMLDETFPDGEFDKKDTGKFLKAVSLDVMKESVDEREVSGIEWKDVQKDVATEARIWFFRKMLV